MTHDDARRIIDALEGVVGQEPGKVSDWKAMWLLEKARAALDGDEDRPRPLPPGIEEYTPERRKQMVVDDPIPHELTRHLRTRAEELAGRNCRSPGQMEALIAAVLLTCRARSGAEAPSKLLPRLRTALGAALREVKATADNNAALVRVAKAIKARDAAAWNGAGDKIATSPAQASFSNEAAAAALVDGLVRDIGGMIVVLDHLPAGTRGRPGSMEEDAVMALTLGWRDSFGSVPGMPNRWEGAAPDVFVTWVDEVVGASGGALAPKSFGDLWTRSLRKPLDGG
jgi:hypothetical protein